MHNNGYSAVTIVWRDMDSSTLHCKNTSIHHVRTLERRRQRMVSLDAMHGEEGWPDMTKGHVFSSGYPGWVQSQV
jgi:hypothetical protein